MTTPDDSSGSTDFHVAVSTSNADPVTLFEQASGLSRGRIKDAMNKGAAWITRGRKTQRLRRAGRTLRSGDELHLYVNPRVLAETPTAPELVAEMEALDEELREQEAALEAKAAAQAKPKPKAKAKANAEK